KIGKRVIWIEGMTNRTTDNRWFQLMLSKTKIIPLLKVKPYTLLLDRNIYAKTYSHQQSCKHSTVFLLLVS
ncbi:hypothetical protein, partial [Enterococcus avium]|uniref:hypothetical protein n=1 Tax=Enterococcus avium TaxID=33945 RepID=UPI00399071D9